MNFSHSLRIVRSSVIALVIFTVLLGLVYPTVVWAASRVMPGAEGSPVTSQDGKCTVALKNLAATQVTDGEGADAPTAPSVPAGKEDPWFHYRPVGATNAGPSNSELAEVIKDRKAQIAQREGVSESQIPPDAVTSSFSGVEATISPEYAALQIPRVAKANGMSEEKVKKLVDSNTHGRVLGVLGEKHVNVTDLDAQLPAAASCRE